MTRYILDRTLPYDNLLMTEGAQSQSFTWGNELIAADDMLYLQDHLGSPIRLIHNWQTPLAYDAFGVMTVGMTPNVRQPFGFTGYEVDSVSGLSYAQARYYSPEQGRFTAEDTAHDGTNWYGYCHANPLRFVDKDGLTALTPDLIMDTRGSDWIGAGDAMPVRSSPAGRTLELPYHYLAPPTPNDMDIGLRGNNGILPCYWTGRTIYMSDAALESFRRRDEFIRDMAIYSGAALVLKYVAIPAMATGALWSAGNYVINNWDDLTILGVANAAAQGALGGVFFQFAPFDITNPGDALLYVWASRAMSEIVKRLDDLWHRDSGNRQGVCSEERAHWFDDYGFVHPFLP